MEEKMDQVERTEEVAEQMKPEPGEAEFSGGGENLNTADVSAEVGEKSPEIIALEEEKKNLIDRMSRMQADFDNFRKRLKLETEELKERANEQLLAKILPIIDNFERALEISRDENDGFAKGVELIYKQLLTFLEKESVTAIVAEGELFDPDLHHAMLKEPAAEGIPEDTIIAVMQKGYMYKGRVLRPAMVKIAE